MFNNTSRTKRSVSASSYLTASLKAHGPATGMDRGKWRVGQGPAATGMGRGRRLDGGCAGQRMCLRWRRGSQRRAAGGRRGWQDELRGACVAGKETEDI